jgi:ribosomal protein S18 acetylase RimI-like enzyme
LGAEPIKRRSRVSRRSGGGVARALIDRPVRWADQRQACEVVLWVADHNRAAWTLYEQIGFHPTGERQPLPSNPTLTESLLRLPWRGQ